MTETETEKVLHVLIGGVTAGRLEQNEHGRVSFTYEEGYRANYNATPLSLSMPLAARNHKHNSVSPFIRGLLPDNDGVLQRWGRRFGVSANSPFALLRHVGEDVAGAVQFVRPDRLAEATRWGGLEQVDDDYIANRLRDLREDRAAWDDVNAPGQFSLAGAQAKFALARDAEGNWGLPTGRAPTTHILKPPLAHLAHQEVNEHLCLRAASRLDLNVAHSEVMRFGDEAAIVLERYDRLRLDDEVIRIHQEDLCQALAVDPARKYERADRGPGTKRIVELLREHIRPKPNADAAIEEFVKALAYNWVIYGPDAHAKNYSLLLVGTNVGLAPLYDISSVTPYPDRFDLPHMEMAMSIDGEYQNTLVTGDRWRALATAIGVEQDQLMGWVRDIATSTPDAMADAARAEEPWIRKLAMTKALVAGLAANREQLLRWIDFPSARAAAALPTKRPTKPFVDSYRKADGTWVSGYPNPRHQAD